MRLKLRAFRILSTKNRDMLGILLDTCPQVVMKLRAFRILSTKNRDIKFSSSSESQFDEKPSKYYMITQYSLELSCLGLRSKNDRLYIIHNTES